MASILDLTPTFIRFTRADDLTRFTAMAIRSLGISRLNLDSFFHVTERTLLKNSVNLHATRMLQQIVRSSTVCLKMLSGLLLLRVTQAYSTCPQCFWRFGISRLAICLVFTARPVSQETQPLEWAMTACPWHLMHLIYYSEQDYCRHGQSVHKLQTRNAVID